MDEVFKCEDYLDNLTRAVYEKAVAFEKSKNLPDEEKCSIAIVSCYQSKRKAYLNLESILEDRDILLNNYISICEKLYDMCIKTLGIIELDKLGLNNVKVDGEAMKLELDYNNKNSTSER